MKVFLSLGFSGRNEMDIMADINRAKEIISKIHSDKEIEFIHNYHYFGHNSIDCLGEAIKKMSKCDYAYFINNWKKHRGCIVEKKICELYDVKHESITI